MHAFDASFAALIADLMHHSRSLPAFDAFDWMLA
jgi:hypothetical protein